MARFTKRQATLAPQRTEFTFDPMTWARRYQIPLLQAVFLKYMDRLITVWHRKAGKDWTWLQILLLRALERPGLYCHVFPTLKQAKEIVWEGPDATGGRFLDIVPPELIADKSESELMIRLKPIHGKAGSLYQLIGTDNLQKRRGPNATGVVFSEYQDMAPNTFQEVFEPMILANKGWAAFAFTPRGRNHAYKLWKAAEGNPRWFRQLLTIQDTRKDGPGEDGSPILALAEIEEKRRRGDSEQLIQQEYFCSWEGQLQGTILGDLLSVARQEGRVGRVPYEVTLPVGIALDFGRDGTAVWFYQTAGREVRVIDYLAFRRKGLPYLLKKLKDGKPYLYGRIILPFDAAHERFAEAQTTADVFETHWPGLVTVLERMPVDQGIDMLRRKFSVLCFDEMKCGADQENGMPSGLDSLGGYRRSWDEKKQDFGLAPVHDEFSHGADALRYAAMDDFARPDWGTKDEWNARDAVTQFNVFTHGRSLAIR